MDVREVFTEKMTFKQNPEGGEGKPCRYLERVLLAEGIMSAKDLMWDLAFLEYGVNDANSIFSSFLCCFFFSHRL